MKLENLNITIEKTSRKKTVSIFIERDGSVRVLAPDTASDDLVEAAVKAKEYQIFTKIAKWKELNHGKVNREYVNGQSFLYLGRNYRLKLTESQDVPLKISGGYFHLDKLYLPQADKVFKAFYRDKAIEKIKESLRKDGTISATMNKVFGIYMLENDLTNIKDLLSFKNFENDILQFKKCRS